MIFQSIESLIDMVCASALDGLNDLDIRRPRLTPACLISPSSAHDDRLRQPRVRRYPSL